VIVLGLSSALLLVAGGALARTSGAPDESRATRALRTAVWALALLVAVEAALGVCGWLGARATLVGLAVATAAIVVAIRRRATRVVTSGRPRAALTVADAGFVGALAGALVFRAWAGLTKTTFLYDTLSYHLHVPATWIGDGRLEIVSAVFGDPSSAYAPANVELWFAFLMAPLRSDYLAGSGQVAFAAVAALAIVATVRELGGRRTPALAAALAFLLIPEIWQQARTAMTDLGMAALLLAVLPFALRARWSGTAGDLLTAAAALGLALGTKYAALALAVPFACLVAAARGRSNTAPVAVAAAAVLLATGGFWYLRNALLTDNPLYPVAGLGLPGLYDRAAMRAWIYHLPVGNVGALAQMLADAGIGFVVAAVAALAWRRRALELGLLVALVALFWLAIPYQESRFLFVAFGVAAVAIGRASAAAPMGTDWAIALVPLVGILEHPTTERCLLIGVGALGAGAARFGRQVPARLRAHGVTVARGALVALGAAGAVALTVGLAHSRARDPGYSVGGGLDDAWRWLRANVQGARIAYTGTNLAFPLWGRELSNRVRYVNVAGGLDDRLDDFGRRLPPRPAATAEPAPYRDDASFETWRQNLHAARTTILFVAALDEIVARNVAADADGFPVERGWADGHPAQFALRYASPDARIYTVVQP
jgi:hypothetical protein